LTPAQRATAARARDPGRAGLADVARGGTLNLAGAAVSAAATLGITILVTRHFHRDIAGAFFAATSLFLIAEAIAGLGAFNGAVYFIARLRSLHSDRTIPVILRAAVLPVAACSVAAAVALLVFAVPLARALLGGQLGQGTSPTAVARALRELAAALPFAALADTFLGASRGYRDMRPTVAIDRVGRSCVQLLGVLAAVLAGSAALLAPLWALPYVPAGVAAWLWLRRLQRSKRLRLVAVTAAPVTAALVTAALAAGEDGHPTEGRAAASAAGFWRFTAPRALASVAQIVIQRLDIVLVAIMRGPAEAAVYTAATRFLVVGQLANAAISMAAQPQLTHLFAVRDRRGANAVYQATTAWLIVLTWPLYLLAMIYGPEVLAVFGHSYRAGSGVMVILGLAMLVATGCGQVDMVLITTGRSSWSLVNGLLAVAVNVALDLTLIPRYGIAGAAVGWAAAIAVTNLVPLVQVAIAARVHPFGPGSAVACLLATLSFGAIPLAMRAAAGTGAVVSGLAVAAGCAVMAAGLWRFRHALQLAVMRTYGSRNKEVDGKC
jgi:O-antigen/teichoic acid export membrane protein